MSLSLLSPLPLSFPLWQCRGSCFFSVQSLETKKWSQQAPGQLGQTELFNDTAKKLNHMTINEINCCFLLISFCCLLSFFPLQAQMGKSHYRHLWRCVFGFRDTYKVQKGSNDSLVPLNQNAAGRQLGLFL